MKRLFIIVLFIISNFGIKAQEVQESNALKILIVPFSRFELHTEINLKEINEINGYTGGDQFYEQLKSTLMESFQLNSTEELLYKVISDVDWDVLQPIKYNLKQKNGHYEANLEACPASKVKEILDKNECDYLLTVNWYRILEEKEMVKKDKVNKIGFYSSHYIDYDVFTRERTIIRSGIHQEFSVPPSAQNLNYQGLRILDLKPVFKNVVDEISVNILTKED